MLRAFLHGNTVFRGISITVLVVGTIWSLMEVDVVVNNIGYAFVVPITMLLIAVPGLLIDLIMRRFIATKRTINRVQLILLGVLLTLIFVRRYCLLA